jgi:hypothetical protein
MAYEIGYRRPPKSSQFTKGKTGNPKGRPKGTKNFLTLLEKELGQSIVVNENGKRKTITRLQAMVKRMVAGALQGDQKAVLTLIEIMRRTGQFEQIEPQNLLPDNYETLLDSFVQQHSKSK